MAAAIPGIDRLYMFIRDNILTKLILQIKKLDFSVTIELFYPLFQQVCTSMRGYEIAIKNSRETCKLLQRKNLENICHVHKYLNRYMHRNGVVVQSLKQRD